MSLPLMVSAVWATLLCGAYLWFAHSTLVLVRSARLALGIVVAVALLARLLPALVLPTGAPYDTESYAIVGDLLRQGQDIYAHPATIKRHPYLPMQMYWMASARWAAEVSHLSFEKIVKLAPISADVVIAVLLFFFLARTTRSVTQSFHGSLLYALNPVPILVAAYHGQFDAIPALCIVLAIMLLPASALAAGAVLGLGILNKSWPVLIAPVVTLWARRLQDQAQALAGLVLIPLLGMITYSVLFDGEPGMIFARALGYNWGVGIWGYTYLLRLLGNLLPGLEAANEWVIKNTRLVTLGALGVVWLVRARHERPEAGALTILVAFLALSHAFSIQYLMWIVPFAIMSRETKWLSRYTVAAFGYMLLTYTTFILEMHITRLLPLPQADRYIIMPASLPAWLTLVAWLSYRLKGERPCTGVATADTTRLDNVGHYDQLKDVSG